MLKCLFNIFIWNEIFQCSNWNLVCWRKQKYLILNCSSDLVSLKGENRPCFLPQIELTKCVKTIWDLNLEQLSQQAEANLQHHEVAGQIPLWAQPGPSHDDVDVESGDQRNQWELQAADRGYKTPPTSCVIFPSNNTPVCAFWTSVLLLFDSTLPLFALAWPQPHPVLSLPCLDLPALIYHPPWPEYHFSPWPDDLDCIGYLVWCQLAYSNLSDCPWPSWSW